MEWKRREGIIPLTQTEIMLVLATVILVLLVASNMELSDARKQVRDMENSRLGSGEPAPPINPDEPVVGELKPNGQGGDWTPLGEPTEDDRGQNKGDFEPNAPDEKPAPDPREPPPQPDDDNYTPQPPQEDEPEPDSPPNAPVSSSSPQPGPETDPGDGRSSESPTTRGGTGRIEEDTTSASAEPTDIEPPESQSAGEPEEDPTPPTKPETPLEPGSGSTVGRVVGFDPCWRRYAKSGRQYYFAYDLTFENRGGEDAYRIVPHRDWRRGVPVVDEALRSGLIVLREHPRGSVTPIELEDFGQRVERALERKRMERADDDYTENCLLAVTLDRDAPGWVAAFVRTRIGFYPITREAPAR